MKTTRIVLKGQNYATPRTESVEVVMSHSVLAGSGVQANLTGTTLEDYKRFYL